MNVEIKYNNNLKNIAENAENCVCAVVSELARRVCENAKTMCPVDTGRLRDSITVSAEGNSAEVFSDTEYAAYQEFGTSKIPPHPYLVPALIAAKENIGSVFGEVMGI